MGGGRDNAGRDRGGGGPDGIWRTEMRLMSLRELSRGGDGFTIMGFMLRFVCFFHSLLPSLKTLEWEKANILKDTTLRNKS